MEGSASAGSPWDPYRVLGVGSGASQQDIARAYRRAARHAHPDKQPADPGAAARFQALTDATARTGRPGPAASRTRRALSTATRPPAPRGRARPARRQQPSARRYGLARCTSSQPPPSRPTPSRSMLSRLLPGAGKSVLVRGRTLRIRRSSWGYRPGKDGGGCGEHIMGRTGPGPVQHLGRRRAERAAPPDVAPL
jgi:curved DNA-binding protein CbpA